MDAASGWARINKSLPDLNEAELRSLVRLLLYEQEPWLIAKLKRYEEADLVIECLGYLATREALPWVLRSLSEREEALQLSAAAALKNFPDQWLRQPLLQMILKQQPAAAKAGEVLLCLGQEALDCLWEAWFDLDTEPAARNQILALLTEAKDIRCEGLAFLALESTEEELILTGIKAVEALNLRSLWGNVVRHLTHQDWVVRGKAINILADLLIKPALPIILALEPDSDSWVEESRLACIKKLSQIAVDINEPAMGG